MNPVVRRLDADQAAIDAQFVQSSDEQPPPAVYNAKGLSVTSQKFLGIDPRVILTWHVPSRYWSAGYQLLGFRSNTGFAPQKYPKNLSAHGQMFLEVSANGSVKDALAEGAYFYTFVLYKRRLLGVFESMSIVRFSEGVPSATTAISRIEQQLALRNLSKDCDLQGIRAQIDRNKAIIDLHRSNKQLADLTAPEPDTSVDAAVRREVEKKVREKLKEAMTRVELVVALQDVQKQLKRNPGWKKLSETQREKLLNDVVRDFDPAEDSFQV